MKLRPSTLLIVVLSCLGSCSDEGEPLITYPSRFVKTEVTFDGGYQMFASTGEITDQKIIDRRIIYDTSQFHYMAEGLMYNGRLDTISFESPDNVIVDLNYGNITCELIEGSPDFILMRTDTTRSHTVMNELSHNVLYFMVEAKPKILSEKLVSSVRGFYQFRYTARESLVFTGYNDELFVYAIMYRWQYHSNGVESGISNLIFNKLNKDFYKELSPTDTVSIMQCFVHLKKM